MDGKKKDVHLTGALAAVLNAGEVKSVVDRLKEKQTVPTKIAPPSSTSQFLTEISTPATTSVGDTILDIDPNECKPWTFANRPEFEMGNLEELADSIQNVGQLEPILIRPLINETNSSYKYEIIYGNRRWRACKLRGLKLKAIVKAIDDQTAAAYQKDENENRTDLSDYAKAIHYKSLIDAGVFKNENQLSIKLNIPRNRFNDLLSYTRIPKSLLENIPNPQSLPLRMAIQLASLAKDPEILKVLIELAPKIVSGVTNSTNLKNHIDAAKQGNKTQLRKRVPVFGKGGAEIFSIRMDSNGAPCFVLHKPARLVADLDALKEIIKEYIDRRIDENGGQF